MEMSRLLVFDLDGTLVDTAPDLVNALNVALAAERLDPIPLARARDLIGAGARALIERGLKLNNRTLPESRIDDLLQIFLTYYGQHIADHSRPYPGLDEQLMALGDQGWRFAICTNKIESYSVQLIEALRMRHWFEAICGSDTFAFKKPDPRHLTETIALAGGGPAIMVGDSNTDVATARAAGIPVIGVTFGYTDIPMRDLRPDALIEHFDDLGMAIHAVT